MRQTIQLTPRLRAAADWVPEGAVLCDVGTDHAHLPAALLLEGKISRAIASDIRPGPLSRAGETVRRYGLEERVELRLCPGLEGIAPGEADTVTICGMGGETILHILEAAPWTKQGVRLILQPQRSQPELRRWLAENGYAVRRERVVKEGARWYALLLAEGGEEPPLSPGEELAGRPAHWIEEPERLEALRVLTEKNERLLRGMEGSSKPEDAPRRAWLQQAQGELTRWAEEQERLWKNPNGVENSNLK
ncbi:MAG: class I SAM-dependent methyltransferase [Clostridiales bacterium]|nr:class I SAM-dependent methyltransferase [Clostridiales bacterium]